MTAIAPGESTVTVAFASDPDTSASIRVNVLTPYIEGVDISSSYIEMTQQETYQLGAYCWGKSEWEKYDRLVWKSSDESVATVDQEGLVTAINPGSAQISVCSEIAHIEASATVVVSERIPDYEVSLPEKTAYRTSVYWLPLELTNRADILGLQCDVRPGEGCEFAIDGEKYKVEMNVGRAPSHNAVSSILDDGTLRILCTSSVNQPIYYGEGEILYIPVRISAEAADSTSFDISGVVISKIDSASEKIDGCSVKVPVADMEPGDLDGDGEINVADVTGVISVVMGNQGYNLTAEAADYNNDGVVDIMDIVNMVDAILHPSKSPGKVKRKEATEDNEPQVSPLKVVSATYERGESTTLEIALEEGSKYIAAQFDIVLPEHSYFLTGDNGGLSVSFESAMASTHSISVEKIEENICRVVIYSLSNATFSDGSKFVNIGIAFDQDAEDEAIVRLANVKLVTSDRQPVNVDHADFTMTGKYVSVESLEFGGSVRIYSRPGEITVSGAPTGVTLRLYTTDGMPLTTRTASSSEEDLDVPCSGTYILQIGDCAVKILVP